MCQRSNDSKITLSFLGFDISSTRGEELNLAYFPSWNEGDSVVFVCQNNENCKLAVNIDADNNMRGNIILPGKRNQETNVGFFFRRNGDIKLPIVSYDVDALRGSFNDVLPYLSFYHIANNTELDDSLTICCPQAILHLSIDKVGDISQVSIVSDNEFLTGLGFDTAAKTTDTLSTGLFCNIGVKDVSDVSEELWVLLPPDDFSEKKAEIFLTTSDGLRYRLTMPSIHLLPNTIYNLESNFERVPFPATGLPVVYVNTPNEVDIDTKEWLPDLSRIIVISEEGSVLYAGETNIKGRGNSTWDLNKGVELAKRPYVLKLGKKAELFDMPKSKKWCLMANYADRTHMRNALAFKIASQTGLDWTPSGEFVELVMNGVHKGNYYLCEQIRIDKNRVDITQFDETSDYSNPEEFAGIFELCQKETVSERHEEYEISETPSTFCWGFKDPDSFSSHQWSNISPYIRNYIVSMEETLMVEDSVKAKAYEKYIDIESFADFWIVNEIAANGDWGNANSVYMHKDAYGKIVAGPIWDFDDFSFGAASASCTYMLQFWEDGYPFPNKYYRHLFNSKDFMKIVRKKWDSYYGFLKSEIPSFIDELECVLKKSDESDFEIYGLSEIKFNYLEYNMSFEEAVKHLKDWYLEKIYYMNEIIHNLTSETN